MTIFRFDRDTAISPSGAGGPVRVELDPEWNVDGRILNGGYLGAVLVRAALAGAAATGGAAWTPVAASTSFAAPARPGPAEVEVTVLKGHGRVASLSATLKQADTVIAAALVTAVAGEHDGAAGPGRFDPPRPDCADAAGSIPVDAAALPGPPGLAGVLDFAVPPTDAGWLAGDFSAGPRLRCWMGFSDGRPVDALAAFALVDMAPPVCFALGRFGWAPTLQLQVAVFAKPAPGKVLLDLAGSPYDGPVVVEDGLLWDSRGMLIARSRQVALPPRG